MAAVSYAHIDTVTGNEPIIVGTRIKVRMIALDRIVYGWDAEEIQRHHPDLKLSQVYSALAYYYDHKEEIDQRIADGDEHATQSRALGEESESPGRRKLRERGLLP